MVGNIAMAKAQKLLFAVVWLFWATQSLSEKGGETLSPNITNWTTDTRGSNADSVRYGNERQWTADNQNGSNGGQQARDTRRRRGMMSKLKDMWKKKMVGKTTGQWSLSTEEAADHFNNYYKCITQKAQEATSIHHGIETPVHAVMVLEGETVSLECTICTRPDQNKLSQQAMWQHLRRSDSSLGPVHYDDRIQMTSQNGLTIKNVDVADAGQYACVHMGSYMAVYQVDILPHEKRRMVRLGEKLLPEVFLQSHNLYVLTRWAAWGPCDTCGVVGNRQRVGTCTVMKVDSSDRVKPRDFPMIDLYPDGVPCRSTALPGHLRRLKVLRRRYEETVVAECNVTCPTEAPPVAVTDSDGNVVELVEPPPKMYSLNEAPPLPRMVKRRVLYEPEGKHLVLTCGSEGQRGAGIRWMRGKRRVDPLSVKRQTHGRVWIDSANRLHLKDLMLSDTAVYNCWERELHIAAIKVLVTSAFQEKLKDYITIVGFCVTGVGSLIAIFCVMRRGRNAR